MLSLSEAIARLNGDGDYIARVLTESLLAERPISEEPELSAQEKDFLISSGEFTPEEFDEIALRVSQGFLPASVATSLLARLHQSMSADDVRGFLDASDEEVQELATTDNLFAVDIAGQQRFPSWQFSLSSPGKLLPHLREIIALVKEQDWQSVSALMSTPQDTMITHGQQTPIEWFRNGGTIDALEDLLEEEEWL